MTYMRGFQQMRYGAKKRELEFDITIDTLMDLYEQQKGLCALSGVRMTYAKDGKGRKDMNISIDRIEQIVAMS